jgi:alkylation response protein AidB-like acyl-CoA dehydrogenase
VQQVTGLLAGQGLASLGTDVAEGGVQELLVVMAELGRAACPAPLLASTIVNLACAAPDALPPAAAQVIRAVHGGQAQVSIAFGTFDGDRGAGDVRVDGGRASGVLRHVDAAVEPTHLFVATPGGLALVEAASAHVRFVPTRSIGASGVATFHVDNAPVTLIDLSPQVLQDLASIARLGLAARAWGAAHRGHELSVEYAKERRQFGRTIGSFQAIQHKLVNNFIALEGVRLALANAAAHHDHRKPSWRFLAAAAVSQANAALRQAALETQHAFGAIGYAEEHEAPRHFKRVHQDVLRMGGGRRARAELAARMLDDGEGLPEYDLGASGNAFRAEVRAWLAEHWTPERQHAMRARPHAHREYDPEFARELGRTGWLGLAWPERFGGQNRSPLEYLAYIEELERAEAPRAGAPIQAVAWMLFGQPEHQQRYLPEILRGEAVYGMWYSEPDSGSDLASMRTRAVRDGDEWVINGQKIWTTSYWGDYMWLAAKTDPDAQPPHAGISMFCVRTDTPGITIRPVKTMYDGEFVNTFFDDVRIPADALVGRLNGGWQILTESLGVERSIVGGMILAKLAHSFELVCDYIRQADGGALARDPVVRDAIGSFAAQIETGRQLALSCVIAAGQGETPPHLAAVTKVFAGELMERFFETVQELLGYEAALSAGAEGAILRGRLEQKLRHSLMWVISLGTNEIQRNLIAQRGLRLPKQ